MAEIARPEGDFGFGEEFIEQSEGSGSVADVTDVDRLPGAAEEDAGWTGGGRERKGGEEVPARDSHPGIVWGRRGRLVLVIFAMNRRQFLAASALAAAPAKRRNVIFILSDDHRYDAMGFLKAQPWLRTPQMDRMASEGVHFKNAFVTTALCSPSRASVLTGVYAHRHRIVDNNTPIPAGTTFFPAYLQKAGYKTGFFGKWHMGAETDVPKPGFDQWVSFRGQGTYLPSPNGLNVNGKKVPQKGYITDELTDYATDWMRTLPKGQPYFLYLSHKAVHAEFQPAKRHEGTYKDATFVYPPTMAAEGEMAQNRPTWVKNQRNSWHGVDYPYHSTLDIADYYKRYAETLMAVDESIGRVFDALKARGELDSTLVIYMGDNGFAFGEHGLIHKRTAY